MRVYEPPQLPGVHDGTCDILMYVTFGMLDVAPTTGMSGFDRQVEGKIAGRGAGTHTR